MNISDGFSILLQNNEVDFEDLNKSLLGIVEKLDNVYYPDDNRERHYQMSGSVGRGTAICDSDVDFCYILPNEVYGRFLSRKGNIQSSLLSEVKTKLQSKYPNTDIKGDGQVVDTNFKKGLFEIVPSFCLNSSDVLVYPDSHDNGKWLTTSPLRQKKSADDFANRYFIYRPLCQILRCWRYEQNVDIKGIEIDMLVRRFLEERPKFCRCRIRDVNILSLLSELFSYLYFCTDSYFKIAGENLQLDLNCKKFSKKAKRARKMLEEADIQGLWENCRILFGQRFPKHPSFLDASENTEQFINQLYPVRIKNKLIIDCNIDCDGFRSQKLSMLLSNDNLETFYVVRKAASLNFYIDFCDVAQPYEIFWKARNVGEEAIKRKQVRGQIIKGGCTHKETSLFHGPHFVECYIVKDGQCVAKSRIDVPIF